MGRGGLILPRLCSKYPGYKYVQTEGECGWGSFDWNAAEHTFERINHYLGNGCEDYTFWNAILTDNGVRGWGWKQNALIRVDSRKHTFTYTPEYYAVKHYTHFISTGTEILSCQGAADSKLPILTVRTKEGKIAVMAGNFNDEERRVTIKVNNKYLNLKLAGHSLNTLLMK